MIRDWKFWAFVVVLIAVGFCWLSGCTSTQKVDIIETVPDKLKITAHTLSGMPKMFNYMVGLFVVGLIFWGFTKSNLGWVVPSAAIGGAVFMVSFARYAEWIGLLALLSVGVFIYKAVQYQRERNVNGKIKEN